jgi:phosphoglycolate phosphatase
MKLVIFDLDGTLVDTGRDITNALNHALNFYGLKSLSLEETIMMIGEGITRLIEKVLGQEKSGKRDLVVQKFIDYYAEHLTDFSKVYPGVRETLERLHGYKKAVISNKREFLSTRLLDKLGLLEFFAMVVGSDTTPERKPSAMPIMHVLTTLGVHPDEAAIVGDSNFDIEAGEKAGIQTIAVTYGYRDKHYLSDADFMIDSFRELPDILDRTSSKPI